MAISNSTDRLNGLVAGLAMKAPCVAVTALAITLEGEQTVNGVAVTDGDRVLVKDQADSSENGIYNVSTSDWQRAADFDGNRDVVDGTLVIVDEVGIYQVECVDDPVVIGTSLITFTLEFVGSGVPDHTHLEEDITDLGNYLENVVEDLTPELGGNLGANGKSILMGGGEVRNPFVSDYEIEHQVLGTTGSIALDYAVGQSASIALSGNVTLSITNPPTSGRYGEIQILIVQDSIARTITWPASFKWPAGTAPDLTTVSSTHIVHAFTVDGGTNWYATHAAEFA